MAKIIGDRYEIGRLIGQGTSAEVRLATEIKTRKAYAAKILDIRRVMTQGLEEQVKREIGILKTLRHGNVVALKEVLQSKKNIYIVMELINGGTLVDELRNAPHKRFTEEVARRYFQQLILGLRYCHKQEVAHRDLKPVNILLDVSGVLKISDFGLSNLQPKDGGLLVTQCGTPHYVAPEVISGEPYNGFKADIWSVGIILYVMLTGCLPFDDDGLKAGIFNGLWFKIRRGEFYLPRFVSADAQELLVRMIEVDPDNRCSIEYIIAHPWFQEGFARSRLDEGDRIDNDTGAPIVKVYESQAVIQQINPHAFEICEHLRGFIFNADHTQRVFVYNSSIADTLKELLELLTRLRWNPKPMKDSFEIKAFVTSPRVMTFSIALESLLIPNRTLIEISLGGGQSAELASPNGQFDETVRIIRQNLRNYVSEEVEPVLTGAMQGALERE